jgi:hypothetical protein
MANGRVTERRWFPAHQPQTLQFAVGLLYWNALLGLIVGLITGGLGRLALLLLLVADFAGAFGIANERKWGYYVAVAAAVLYLVLVALGAILGGGILNLVFQIALVALLLHPMSRNYYKRWFR